MVKTPALPPDVESVFNDLTNDDSVLEVWLMGSRASGTATSLSDWDLLVLSNAEPTVVPARMNGVDVLWSGPTGAILLEGRPETLMFEFKDFQWRETENGCAEYRGRKFTDAEDGVARDASIPLQVFVSCRAVRLWKKHKTTMQ